MSIDLPRVWQRPRHRPPAPSLRSLFAQGRLAVAALPVLMAACFESRLPPAGLEPEANDSTAVAPATPRDVSAAVDDPTPTTTGDGFRPVHSQMLPSPPPPPAPRPPMAGSGVPEPPREPPPPASIDEIEALTRRLNRAIATIEDATCACGFDRCVSLASAPAIACVGIALIEAGGPVPEAIVCQVAGLEQLAACIGVSCTVDCRTPGDLSCKPIPDPLLQAIGECTERRL